MIPPRIPDNEAERLSALQSYGILDSGNEQEYDDIALLASEICQTPICVISLIDEKRQWLKAKVGLSVNETSRDISFCGHTILNPSEMMIVNDARKDERFTDNPLVTGDLKVVFYAGVPLKDENGFALGTLCTIDSKPRELTDGQIRALKVLSENVISLLSVRKKNRLLENSLHHLLGCINFSSPYFLWLSENGKILEYGRNFKDSVPDIKIGENFSSFFQWNNSFNLRKILDETNERTSPMLFFSNLNQKQKYKCSVRRQDEQSYFIFASPVINTQLPIGNYNIGINHFPKQDYIAEYLFLQQAATKGLADSGKLNELLQIKNKELEMSKNLLIKTNSLLEEKVNERTKEVKNLALFPLQNPNPVFEVSYLNKEITYINPAGLNKIPDPEKFTFEVLSNLFVIDQACIENKDTAKQEFEWQGNFYERNIFFLEDRGVFRLYLHDISDIKHKQFQDAEKSKAFITQQNALLEIRSLPQDLSLEEKLKFIHKKNSEVLQCNRCSVWFYDHDKTMISSEYIYSKNSGEFLQGTSIRAADVPLYFKALERKIVIDAHDAENHPATSEFRDVYLKPLGIKSMLDIPLIQAENSIGVICNEYYTQKESFSDDEISFARSVADVIILALETEQLKLSRKRLEEKNQSLNEAMERLVNMQSDLIQQEKLATLGMLIAGIAHEINTPLGAIKASNENLQEGLTDILDTKLKDASPEILDYGHQLFSLSQNNHHLLSTREERLYVKSTEAALISKFPQLNNKTFFAKKLVELGFKDLETDLDFFIQNPQNIGIFAFASDLSKIRKSVQTIALAADKASKVVKALNTFSHGNLEKELSSFSLYENIESVITLLWNKIKHGATVINSIGKDVLIFSNPEELSQVWTNIMNNALQASNGKCTIWIDYALENGGHVIRIANNGPAIPQELIPRIFEAFFSSKKRGEGTGLGLSIVKNILEKNNGSIECISNDEKTTFTIHLPCQP
jgi:signal transduction histidine kinase